MSSKSPLVRFLPPLLAVLLLALVARFLSAPVETQKWIGAPFLVVPTALGILPPVSADDVHTVNLKTRSPVVQIDAPSQHAVYAAIQLRGYKAGTRATDPNSMMRTIASRLTDEEIDAVASYLQGMR